ncbi:MAG TPA: o-succinylbenzoate--CoA ligase [Bacillales bacterium]|nr:o-succinylbenzoate--CoA ligase [Bacillales bacterium]
MQNWLEKRAFLTPERMALRCGETEWTFAELRERARSTAGELASRGAREGERAAVLMRNGLPLAEIIHAMPYAGLTLVPLNTRLTVSELAYQVKDAEVSMLICDETNADKAADICGIEDGIDVVTYRELSGIVEEPPALNEQLEMDAIHSVIYTSGTTGYPKGVMLSHANHWWSAIGSSLNLGLDRNDRWLAAVPLFHVSGLSILMRGVIYGIGVVIHESFDAARANRDIIEQRITIMSVVGAMLSDMLEELGDRSYPDTFRCMLLGGGPAPRVLLEQCKDRTIPVYQTYGMSETASQIATLGPEYMLSKLGSAGKPLFPAELKIVADGKELPNGEVGEIVVKGPNVTNGYLNREADTNETIQEGWLYSGDLGYLDEDGFLYVLDRRKDLIVSGGENVYPAEVEAALLAHPEVADAGVTGVEDARWGAVPVGFVVMKAGAVFDEEQLLADCCGRLASYKVPRRLYEVPHLPRNASRKLLRRKLPDLRNELNDWRNV